MTVQTSKNPQVDIAEDNAFFPSEYSLSQYTSPVSDLDGVDYPKPYRGKHKILVIAADERYLPTDNGKLFSTGNHPIETLLPLYHLHAAGFEFEVATISGLMTKFEYWAMPHKDEKVMPFFEQHKSGFAPIFPDICYHLTHYKPAAADIPVASDNPAHYADAIRYNARTPLQGSLLPLTRLVWA